LENLWYTLAQQTVSEKDKPHTFWAGLHWKQPIVSMVEHISTNTGPEENTMPLSPSELPHQLLGLPWQFLVLGLALCLIFSALGFRRVEYFVSLGYAASIAAQAVAFPFLYRDTIRGLALLQAVCSSRTVSGWVYSSPFVIAFLVPETAGESTQRSFNVGARSRLQSGSEYRSFTFSFSCRHCSPCQRKQAEWRWHRPPWGFC